MAFVSVEADVKSRVLDSVRMWKVWVYAFGKRLRYSAEYGRVKQGFRASEVLDRMCKSVELSMRMLSTVPPCWRYGRELAARCFAKRGEIVAPGAWYWNILSFDRRREILILLSSEKSGTIDMPYALESSESSAPTFRLSEERDSWPLIMASAASSD